MMSSLSRGTWIEIDNIGLTMPVQPVVPLTRDVD